MNETNQDPAPGNYTREEMLSALFANMVIQQTNMAMMLMGKVAHPETGQFMQDFNTAKMFIDQLEMLEAKTKGNLSKQEDALMKQALSSLHMTFVEAIDAADKPGGIIGGDAAQEKEITPEATSTPEPAPASAPAPAAEAPKPSAPDQAAADESRKKFSKKY